jgi:hypothetical protein
MLRALEREKKMSREKTNRKERNKNKYMCMGE